MLLTEIPFADLLLDIIDNRGRTCPVSPEGLPLIATNCITNDRLYPSYDTDRHVSQETYTTWFRGHPLPGDLIFVCKGSPGRVCMAPDPVDFCIAQDMVAIRANPERVYPRFLFAILRSPIVQGRIGNMHVGSLIPHFKKGDFDKLLIPVPDKTTQKCIGDMYFELSAKIESNRRTSRALERVARAIFRAWFVDFEPVKAKATGARSFPGMPREAFEALPSRLVDSELGPIPEGWKVSSLSEIARYVNGKPFTKDAKDSGRMIIRIAELNSGPGSSTKYSDVKAEPDNTAYFGDILFAWSGSLDVYRWHRDEAIVNQHIFKVIPLNTPSWFVYYHLREAMPTFKAIASDKATTMGHIQRHHLEQARIATPSTCLWSAAGGIINPLYTLSLKLERESILFADIRDYLLPQLLTGQQRVSSGVIDAKCT